jgi:hypothetical protein
LPRAALFAVFPAGTFLAGVDLLADVFAAAGFPAADLVAAGFADFAAAVFPGAFAAVVFAGAFAGVLAAAAFAGALAAGFRDPGGAFAVAPFAAALPAAALAAPVLPAGFAVALRFVVVGVLAKLPSLVEARQSRKRYL